MLRHIVMWKFRPGTEAERDLFLTGLQGLYGAIPELKSCQVLRGMEGSDYDAVLISEFADRAALEALLPQFTGPIAQIPPMYSAIKINGQKLYDLARKGKEVERKPRNITIFELELLEQVSETDYLLRCRCSKGTYLRTLCHDIGQALGCGGAMFSLCRTMAAGYTLAEAVSLEDVQAQGEALLRPVESMFTAYPLYTLPSPGKEVRVRNGNPITVPELADGTYRVHGKNGEFLCLSRAENGTLTSIKNFFGA